MLLFRQGRRVWGWGRRRCEEVGILVEEERLFISLSTRLLKSWMYVISRDMLRGCCVMLLGVVGGDVGL